MKKIHLSDGSTTAYWEFNPSKKPTIVMVHGFRGTHHGLQKIIDNLPDFHIIVPDLPGFGASEPFTHRPHSLDHYTLFLQEFIDSFHFKTPPILLGHSFGSIIASHYAAAWPTTIKKLILVNPIGTPALAGPRSAMTRLAIAYYWLGRTLPSRISKKWLAARPIVKVMSITMAKTKDKSLQAFIHDQHLQYFSTFASPTVVAEAFNASVTNDVREVADKLLMPTLLIAGDQDDITPLKKQQKLAQVIPHATLVALNDVGHLIHYEKPVEAATAIREFLTSP
jgi:pimeloyl-ACP methyl ester carboxylesterase